jgi:cyclophilin family peptidyl-prolyl cis-trans isomerase
MEIELYHDHVPVTVQNFLSICCGDNKKKLTYKKCPIHRIVPGRFLETGDITKGTGKGGTSIYGKHFAEEGHKLKHAKEFCQWYVSTNTIIIRDFVLLSPTWNLWISRM